MIEVYDYRNCFVISTSAHEGKDTNTCRSQILCRCELIDGGAGGSEEFFLCKECVGEHMYPEGEMVQIPTSEVVSIVGREHCKQCKKFADHGDDVTHVTRLDEKVRSFAGELYYYSDMRYVLPRTNATPLETPDDIIDATLGARAMVARTTIHSEDGKQTARIEYPVVYSNCHPPTKRFQIDVGPVIFPDFAAAVEVPIARLELAYVLFNEFDLAEFAIRTPTTIGDGPRTLHYSKAMKLKAKNELFLIET